MRRTFLLLSTLLLPSLAAAQTAPASSSPAFIAGLLANDARDLLRDPALATNIAASQASLLLQFSARLDPDIHTLRLLAETARVTGKNDLYRDTLRALIASDPGDLVSQVRYIDLLATESQTMDARASLYKNALANSSFDAQIRSEIAVRLARLAEDRGDPSQAREFLAQAVKLNDVNIGALRDTVRLAASESSPDPAAHLRALSALLVANPYQPDAWLQVARLCQAAGIHDRANEFLQTAGEQLQINGSPPGGEFFLDLALEQATSGQRVKALTLANGLSQLPDAPLAALLITELLAQDSPPLPVMPSATSQPALDRPAEIRKRLAELLKDPNNALAFADAASADLTFLQKIGPNTAAWVDAYAKLVDPADATLARLRGWLLYRQGKTAEARAQFDAIADTDPLAQVGIARLLIDQGSIEQARTILQKLWNTNPASLLALQITVAAARGKIELADSDAARAMRAAIARLTPGLSGMHRQPRDVQLISTSFRKDAVALGEPVFLQIRITNTSDRALPVGPEGMVKSTVGIAAVTRAANAQSLGLFAIEDVQRIYRLEPRQMFETTLRVDQGKLSDLLQQNPENAFSVSVTAVTAPRILSPEQYSAGVGGLAIAVGDFQRGRHPLTAEADLLRLAQELTTLTGDKQLARIQALGALLVKKPDILRPELLAALKLLVASKDPFVRASLLRSLPPQPINADLDNALDALSSDPDPLVRLIWSTRQGRIMMFQKPKAAAAWAALQRQAAAEKEPLTKEWIDILQQLLAPTPAGAGK